MKTLVLVVFIIFDLILLINSDPSPPNDDDDKFNNNQRPPPSHRDNIIVELEHKCNEDIDNYCKLERKLGGLAVIYCLERHRIDLSDVCNTYLGTTTFGGCNDESLRLCGDNSNINDIHTCLENNKDKLSAQCLTNIMNLKSDGVNPWKKFQLRSKKVTSAITALSMAYLLIPLLLSIWAMFMMFKLDSIQKDILSENNNMISSSSLAESRGELYSSQKTFDEVSQSDPWQISFLQLSYWVLEITDWRHPLDIKKKQILRDVSGEFNPGSVTAIMGPSGSGKTTLLKLLGGQLTSGEWQGTRLINKKLNKQNYDKKMRSQGYVHQQDNLLETLTVWQTLYFAAVLRISHELSINDKVRRAAKVMTDMGLSSAANTIIGGNGGHGGISGGQRRRLTIAVELLVNPSVLFLDEPTSGLDASSSLNLVQLLRQMSATYNSTIVLTIHQPRSEVFSLFDSLLLLGTGGFLVYSGPTATAANFLSLAPCVSLNIDMYRNPGDFIIDVLGLSANREENNVREYGGSSFFRDGLIKGFQKVKKVQNDLGRTGSSDNDVNIEMVDITHKVSEDESEAGLLAGAAPPPFIRGQEDLHETKQDEMMILMESLNKHYIESEQFQYFNKKMTRDIKTQMNENNNKKYNSVPVYDDDNDVNDQEKNIVEKVPPKQSRPREFIEMPSVMGFDGLDVNIRHGAGPFTQIWLLFARRVHVFKPTLLALVMFLFEISMVTGIVTIAFSYQVDTELERPYQIVMLIFMISTYSMILQYLILIPEYMTERKVLLSERSSGVVGFGWYIISAMLTEIPRAAMQCCILIGILYMIHPLNSDIVNITFCVVCLMVGVSAWQSLMCVCAVLTDNIGVAYTMSFLALGSGTLFGGLIVRLTKIPFAFKWLYYISIPAITQRALVVNDLQCCYITATCNSIKQDMHLERNREWGPNTNATHQSSTFCPPGLQFTGDGSDEGNLGRLYLRAIGLEQDNPFESLLILFWANIIFRILAMAILILREYLMYQLKEVKEHVLKN